MPKTGGKVLLCIFIGVGIFAFSEALTQSKTNKSLSWQIENTFKPKLAQLEKDTAQLKEEKVRLTDVLAETKSSLVVLEEESAVLAETLNEKNNVLQELQKANQEKEQAFVRLFQQHSELKGENVLLKEKITAMFLEFNEMRQAFSSPEKLRERMRSLRSGVKKKNKLSYVPQRSGSEQDIVSSGNGGYLIRNGKSPFPKVKIRVSPVEG